ncbi:MAG: hypothetical protein ACYTXI_29210 [Nostoc sp.]
MGILYELQMNNRRFCTPPNRRFDVRLPLGDAKGEQSVASLNSQLIAQR